MAPGGCRIRSPFPSLPDAPAVTDTAWAASRRSQAVCHPSAPSGFRTPPEPLEYGSRDRDHAPVMCFGPYITVL